MNKKGSFLVDFPVFSIMIVVGFLFAVIILFSLSQISTGLEAANNTYVDQGNAYIDTYESQWPTAMDYGLVLCLILVYIGLLVSTYLLDNFPGLFIFFIIVNVIVTMCILPVIDFIATLSEDAVFTSFFNSFPLFMFLVNHWIYLIIFEFAGIIITYYAKDSSAGGYL